MWRVNLKRRIFHSLDRSDFARITSSCFSLSLDFFIAIIFHTLLFFSIIATVFFSWDSWNFLAKMLTSFLANFVVIIIFQAVIWHFIFQPIYILILSFIFSIFSMRIPYENWRWALFFRIESANTFLSPSLLPPIYLSPVSGADFVAHNEPYVYGTIFPCYF